MSTEPERHLPAEVAPAAAPAVPAADLPSGPVGSWDLDLAAASLRMDAGDVDAMFESLAAKLERILPGRVSVERQGGLRRSKKRVARVVVDTGAGRLEASRDRGAPVFSAAHAVRGITLGTAELPADEWFDRLVTLVRDEAARSGDVRDALERMMQ